MKRHGNLFDKIISMDNLREAHRKARKGKAHYKEVQWVNENEEEALEHIQHLLLTGSFKTSEYTVEETIKGDKLRTIHKLPYYPDRIVQHAIVNICKDFWINSLIRDTYQSIPGRGTSDCFKRINKVIKRDKPRYAIKIDIKKFYPSIKPKHLLKPNVLRIKCKPTMSLLTEILTSLPCLPLGNHTSQYAGNLLLSPIDWFAKQDLKAKHYFRYCDDIVILSDNLSFLYLSVLLIQDKLEDLELEIKEENEAIDLSKNYLDFVGFRMNHNKTLLRKKLARNFKNACSCGKKRSLPAYFGWIKQANARKLWHKNLRRHQWKLS